MIIIEILLALLISCALAAEFGSSAAHFGRFLRESQSRHRRIFERRSDTTRYQSSLNISEPLITPSNCIVETAGEDFSELACEVGETGPIRLLAPRGATLIELLVGIALTGVVLSALPALIKSASGVLKSGDHYANLVAEELLLSSLVLSQIARAAALPGIQTIKVHPLGAVADPSGAPLQVSSNTLNRPADGSTPISFLIPDLSYVLTPAGGGRFCQLYRTEIAERRTSAATITRYIAVTLSGVWELSARTQTAPSIEVCPGNTYTLQLIAPSSSSTIFELSSEYDRALILIPVKDEFTIYLANSGAIRRMSNLTTENQPIIGSSRFHLMGSVAEANDHQLTFNIEIPALAVGSVWHSTHLSAATSKIDPVSALDLLQ